MNSQLKRIVAMANYLIMKQREVNNLKEQLNKAYKEQLRIEMEDLPELMREAELNSFELKDGSTVTLDNDISCGITKANYANALAWLEKHGFGGLIKTQIQIDFNRDDYEQAIKIDQLLLSQLEKIHVDAGHQLKETIHTGTLKSFIKEQMRKGKTVPAKLFSIHPLMKVSIKPSIRSKEQINGEN